MQDSNLSPQYLNTVRSCIYIVFNIRNWSIIRTMFRIKWVCVILLLSVISGINHMADTFTPPGTSISSLSAKSSGGPLHFKNIERKNIDIG